MSGPLDALAGLRVLDLSDGVAGSYCTKLLADCGADVLKVEPPGGHPLRSWSPSGSVGRDGDPDGVLFRYLAAGQHSVIADIDKPAGRARVLGLAADSDVVVSSSARAYLEERALSFAALGAVNPGVTMVTITPFGLSGPRAAEQRGDFLLQALSGSLDNHGTPDGSPLAVGGALGEWIAGVYAATGALAARARTTRTGRGELVDVSVLESLALTLVCYPSVAASMPGGVRQRAPQVMIPGIEPCKDGFVGLTTITAQQWHDFLAMIDRPDLIEDLDLNSRQGRLARTDEVLGLIRDWTLERTAAEIVQRATDFRVPAAPVLDGSAVPHLEHLAGRGLFGANPRGGFPHPRPPYRTTATSPRPVRPAPRPGEHAARLDEYLAPGPATRTETPSRDSRPADADDLRLPLDGIRVLDLTAFWAGPCATQYLAAFGADVIKIESVQRPDPIRFNVSVSPAVEQWYEQGYMYLAANLGKRGVTLNLASARGRELFLDLVARSDVVVENFSPRVMENFGLTYDELRAARSDVVMVRMPGWGLDGPWRERPALANTMEQASGMAWVTGYEDGPPMAPGLCDPLAGIHAAFAVLAALEQRRATGRGQQIEVSMIDLAVNVAAEPILEFAAYGRLMSRQGNRSPRAAPQGVYPCAGGGDWIALSIGTDAEWEALRGALGRPVWAEDPLLTRLEGRRAAHDQLDTEIARWCGSRSLAAVLAELRRAGVGAEPVVAAYAIDEDEHMRARGFWEPVAHPIVGTHTYPGLPMRLSRGPLRWHRSPAPLLGEHTAEVFMNVLDMTAEEVAALREAGVVGDRPASL